MNMCDKLARENPSFSSTLLDSIYRSIDESPSSSSSSKNTAKSNQNLIFYKETTMKKKQTKFSPNELGIDPMLLNSSSTSSDSSSGAGFSISSSDSDSFYHNTSNSRPKPIRTHQAVEKNNSQGGGGSSNAKSMALKIYSELKKVKQPISPGAKLTSFINSLFNSGNAKKTTKYEEKITAARTCSSASSFSRSCLSMRTKSSSRTTQRPVRFCLDDGDSMSRPCEQIKTHQAHEMRKPVDNNELDYKKLLNNYRKMKNEAAAAAVVAVVDEYDNDDVASYASSDLFELDHLGDNGKERYLEELPVYETTHFDTNRAIVNGLIL